MKSKLSLRDRLAQYLKRNHGRWFASGELQRLVVQYTNHTPRSCVRRLQEMTEAGTLEVEYRKGHAYYRFSDQDYNKDMLTWFDSGKKPEWV